jgi:hypothetical protein
MNYSISEMISQLNFEVVNKYEELIIQLLKKEFVFNSDNFDDFILVLQFTPKERIGKFGPDCLQVSKKEKTLFLGVNLANEMFKEQESIDPAELEYVFSRIREVKNENLSRLIKNGLVN